MSRSRIDKNYAVRAMRARVLQGALKFDQQGEAYLVTRAGERKVMPDFGPNVIAGSNATTNLYFKVNFHAKADVINHKLRTTDAAKNKILHVEDNHRDWYAYYDKCYQYFISYKNEEFCPMTDAVKGLVNAAITNENQANWKIENDCLLHIAPLHCMEIYDDEEEEKESEEQYVCESSGCESEDENPQDRKRMKLSAENQVRTEAKPQELSLHQAQQGMVARVGNLEKQRADIVLQIQTLEEKNKNITTEINELQGVLGFFSKRERVKNLSVRIPVPDLNAFNPVVGEEESGEINSGYHGNPFSPTRQF